MATKKKPTVAPSPVTVTKAVIVDSGDAVKQAVEVVESWPKLVVIKNDTSCRFIETVSRTLLEPHSDRTITVSKDEFARINNNFKQLNILNRWENGLQIIYPLGVEDA